MHLLGKYPARREQEIYEVNIILPENKAFTDFFLARS